MSIGMTYEEFWYKDVRLVEHYRRADELRTRKRNQELWLQGAYFYEALVDASPMFRFSMSKRTIKPDPYAKEPYPVTADEVREREERKRRQKEEKLKAEFAAFVASMKNRQPPAEAHPEQEGGEVIGNND